MLGTSLTLTTAKLLDISEQDNFESAKISCLKNDLVETVKRLGFFKLYKDCQREIKKVTTGKHLIAFVDQLSDFAKLHGLAGEKLVKYKNFINNCLNLRREDCKKMLECLKADFDIITTDCQTKMLATVKKYDTNGKILSLFKRDQNGKIETYYDKNNIQRYRINRDAIDWSGAEEFYKIINKYGFKVHGHTILWHDAVPYQIKELAKSNLPVDVKKKMATDFLYGYMKSYAKSIKENKVNLESIDILNEIAGEDEDDYLRKSVWRDLMGDDYYIEVLKMAKEIFPDSVKLDYNDYNEFYPTKKKNILQVLKNIQLEEMKTNRPLLDYLGLQCHMFGTEFDYDSAFKEYMDQANKGIFPKEVRVTELDSANCNNPSWQQEQMKQVVNSAINNGVKNFLCWSFADPLNDSLIDSENSGIVDKHGNKTDLYDKLSGYFSEKTKEVNDEALEMETENKAEEKNAGKNENKSEGEIDEATEGVKA